MDFNIKDSLSGSRFYITTNLSERTTCHSSAASKIKIHSHLKITKIFFPSNHKSL